VARGHRAPLVVPVDLIDPRAVDVIKASVWETYGRIDILVSNAGGSRPAWPAASEDVWAEGFGLSFTAVRRLTLAFLPHMQEQRWGRIINITTTQEPMSVNVDQVAKAAQHAWAKGLSREIGQHGVTINSVAPGRIMSEQIERNYPTAEEREQFAAANIPVGYLGEPHDIGHAVAFLASPRARYITGSIVYVDGGLHRSSF
jgi:3-oxoacyl-[acyl-carrier protein] reductase